MAQRFTVLLEWWAKGATQFGYLDTGLSDTFDTEDAAQAAATAWEKARHAKHPRTISRYKATVKVLARP